MSQMTAIVDKLLTQASAAYIPDGFACEKILPEIRVAQKSGKLAKYGTNHLRVETNYTGGRGEYRRVEAVIREQSTYTVEGHGLEGLVTADDIANLDRPYDAMRDEVIGLTSQLLIEKEKTLGDALGDTGTLTQNTTLSGTAQWNDYSNSDPIGDAATARTTIVDGCGRAPNAIIMSWQVWNQIRFSSKILDALGFKYNKVGGLNQDELAVAFGVDKIIISSAMYESANEGQTSSLSPCFGKNVIFAHIPDRAAPYQVSLGYRIQQSAPRRVYKYSLNNPPGSFGVLVEDNYDLFLSNVKAAYLVKNAVA
tara:strand:- start:2346 stop:3275 length:930 start_codon:yes stop_codon:yes gene_type:complete